VIVVLVTAAFSCGPNLDIEDPEVREYAERIYSNKDKVRFASSARLGEMGPKAAEAIPHILKRLEVETNWLVAERSVIALGEIGSTEAIPGLLSVLKNNGSLEEIVREIEKELESDDRSQERVVKIIKMAVNRTPDKKEFEGFLEEFEGENFDSAKLGEFLKKLHERIRCKISHNINVKASAILSIGMILEDSEPSPSVDEATTILATYLSPDTEFLLRNSAVEVLGEIGRAAESAVPALKALKKILKTKNQKYWEEDCLVIDETLKKCTRPSDSPP